jgi:hypothetical protein
VAGTSKGLAASIKEAVDAVEEAGVPKELREVALTKALEVTLGTAMPRGRRRATQDEEGDGVGEASTPKLEAVAKKLKQDPSKVERVFEQDGEEIFVIVTRAKLADQMKEAQRQVALLVSAARQAAGLDEDGTSLALLKEHAEQHGVVDSNFSKNMRDIPGTRLKGVDRQRTLKVNNPGYESAGDLVADMADGANK